MEDAVQERRNDIDELLSSTFNSILRVEEKSIDNRFTRGLSITEIHTIDAEGYFEKNPTNIIAALGKKNDVFKAQADES